MVIPSENMKKMFARMNVPKVMMRRKECDHGQMLYSADGYSFLLRGGLLFEAGI